MSYLISNNHFDPLCGVFQLGMSTRSLAKWDLHLRPVLICVARETNGNIAVDSVLHVGASDRVKEPRRLRPPRIRLSADVQAEQSHGHK